MKQVLNLYKKKGETPLECMERYRTTYDLDESVPMTYAGRLDPAASGVLPVLTGNACHKKKTYLALPKQYEADILFGISTDTYDLLGKLEKVAMPPPISPEFLRALEGLEGVHQWSYPPYSSKTVDGKPLWEWTREGKLGEISIPERQMNFSAIKPLRIGVYEHADILAEVHDILLSVKGDFRQADIWDSWKKLPRRVYPHITFSVGCSSGSYIRTLAHKMGELFDSDAVLFGLTRTHVGDMSLEDARRV